MGEGGIPTRRKRDAPDAPESLLSAWTREEYRTFVNNITQGSRLRDEWIE